MELGSTHAVKEAVKAGLGVAAISCLAVAEDFKKGDIRIINLIEGNIERTFTMLVHRDKFQTTAVVKFREFALEETIALLNKLGLE
jgi:DNA-binding transcriptional LysR family regulator